jgi:hypothetical protein
MKSIYYSKRLNETRKNLTANPGRSPLMRSYGYASAGDRPALFARFPLISFPSCNMQASGYSGES